MENNENKLLENNSEQTPSNNNNKKKMNDFVKFPLVLGITALCCGGVVCGIHFGTRGIIETNAEKMKYNDAYDMLDGQLDTSKGVDGVTGFATIPETVGNIKAFAQCYVSAPLIEGTDAESVRFYTIETAKGYSGTMKVSVIIIGGKGNGQVYKFKFNSNVNEDSLGVQAFVNATMKPGYTGENFEDYLVGAASAKVTLPVVQGAIDEALDHYNKVGATYTGEDEGNNQNNPTTLPEGLAEIVGGEDKIVSSSIKDVEFEANDQILELKEFETNGNLPNNTTNKAYYAKLQTAGKQFGNIIFSAVIFVNNNEVCLHNIYLVDDTGISSNTMNSGNPSIYQKILSNIFNEDSVGKVANEEGAALYITGSSAIDKGTIGGASSAETAPDIIKVLQAAAAAIKA